MRVIQVNPHFKILDKKSSKNDLGSNTLRKPFQWYRDHWYRPGGLQGIVESTTLPHWMKEYFLWHREQMSNPPPKQKYLVLQCLEQDRQCGGLADRILALPFLILMAAQSKRVFIIVWTVPFPLEEFLMPNAIDWMLPPSNDMNQGVSQTSILSGPSIIDRTVFTRVKTIVDAVQDDTNLVVRARLQDYLTATDYYDQHPLNELDTTTSSIDHYRDIFQALFVPSPPMAEAMKLHGVPGINDNSQPYAVAHYRALYGPRTPTKSFLQLAATNAVHCASQLLPGTKVAFLSDYSEAVAIIQRTFGEKV